jgi:predicted alpha/beta-fold hydrolase
VTRHGGHCGFFERLRGPTWLESRILAILMATPPQPTLQ